MYLELVGIVGSTSEGGCEYDLQQPMQDSESRPSPYLVACYHCLSRAGRRSEATWTVNRSPASSILTNHPYETRLSFLGPGTKCFHNLSLLSMYLYTCVHSCMHACHLRTNNIQSHRHSEPSCHPYAVLRHCFMSGF